MCVCVCVCMTGMGGGGELTRVATAQPCTSAAGDCLPLSSGRDEGWGLISVVCPAWGREWMAGPLAPGISKRWSSELRAGQSGDEL